MSKNSLKKIKDWFGNHRDDYDLSDTFIVKDFYTNETLEKGSFLINIKKDLNN